MARLAADARSASTRSATARCAEVLPAIDVGVYDCLQSNLALIFAAAHGPGAGERLGRHLLATPRPQATGLWTVDAEPAEEVPRCASLLCVQLEPVETASSGDLRATASDPSSARYVVADAFDMPWLPYYQKAHMPHSFLLGQAPDGSASVVDAYDNQTEWGAAKPGVWELPWADLPIPQLAWRCRAEPPATVAPTLIAIADTTAYETAFRDHADRRLAWEGMAVDTWLLARRHTLFATAHAGVPALAAAAGAVADRWRRLAVDAFVGFRRVSRGRAEPSKTFAELADCLAASRGLRDVDSGQLDDSYADRGSDRA